MFSNASNENYLQMKIRISQPPLSDLKLNHRGSYQMLQMHQMKKPPVEDDYKVFSLECASSSCLENNQMLNLRLNDQTKF